jgi:hypothetical protein
MPPVLRPRRRKRRPLDINLTGADYKVILNFYGIPYANFNAAEIKKEAEKVLGTKVCKCIKRVQKSRHKPANESDAIAICKNSVLTKKKLRIYNFQCKRTYKLLPQRRTRKKLVVYKTVKRAL